MAKRKSKTPTPRERVVSIVESFDGATATPVLSHVKLQWGKKLIGWYMEDHHGNGRVELQVRGVPGRSQQLVAGNPDVYFIPSYHGKKGNIGVWLDVPSRDAPGLDWDQIEQILREAYAIARPEVVLTRKRKSK
jgi:hypothetical protein